MKATEILLYMPLLKWYLKHGLKVTPMHEILPYKTDRLFNWFPDKNDQAWSKTDKDEEKKIAGETSKLKGKCFYGKIIEDIMRHCHKKFTTDGKKDAALTLPFLGDLEETSNTYKAQERKERRRYHDLTSAA